jgi:excisionase family DNA binding protein
VAKITTKDAAVKLGLSRVRVLQLISAGKLPAEKIGRDYLIEAASLAQVRNRPKPGRPRKGK